jgi:hypothetical protein
MGTSDLFEDVKFMGGFRLATSNLSDYDLLLSFMNYKKAPGLGGVSIPDKPGSGFSDVIGCGLSWPPEIDRLHHQPCNIHSTGFEVFVRRSVRDLIAKF